MSLAGRLDRTIAGVDGCKAGWVVVSIPAGQSLRVDVHQAFSDLLEALDGNALVAVDMPIGLPDLAGKGGRGPEQMVRPLIGARQSSVFAIPSRTAIFAEPGPFADIEAWSSAHRRASAVARATSDPPRGVSIQAFGLFSKIREIDTALRAESSLQERVFESHPEVAFWRLNGEVAMMAPKKMKGRINVPGMEERKSLLAGNGLSRAFLDQPTPRGACLLYTSDAADE